jgi:hypothetical protein
MRRALIQRVLPLAFCLIPLLAALLIALATPKKALGFYLEHIRESRIDWIILSLGLVLFCIQLLLSWRALQWRATAFDEQYDRWLSHLAQAAEWFPMLGLIGTVAGILQTFGDLAKTGSASPQRIIELYAPAITATGSGLFMALINILPTWVVLIGRDLILELGGGTRGHSEDLP